MCSYAGQLHKQRSSFSFLSAEMPLFSEVFTSPYFCQHSENLYLSGVPCQNTEFLESSRDLYAVLG
jgi:hypothetical protein